MRPIEYSTSTKGPLHAVLAAVAAIYHAQPYGTAHCGGRSRVSVCYQGKGAPDGASRAAAASKSRAAPKASRTPVDRTTALASAAALSKVLGWLLVVQ